jgi:hypothetical protein
MSWWWDNLIALEPERYYPRFGAVARFVDGIRWDRERFVPAETAVASSSRPVVAYGLRGRKKLLLWLKDDAFQWNAPGAAGEGPLVRPVVRPLDGRVARARRVARRGAGAAVRARSRAARRTLPGDRPASVARRRAGALP